jgi:hypothetical protein
MLDVIYERILIYDLFNLIKRRRPNPEVRVKIY